MKYGKGIRIRGELKEKFLLVVAHAYIHNNSNKHVYQPPSPSITNHTTMALMQIAKSIKEGTVSYKYFRGLAKSE